MMVMAEPNLDTSPAAIMRELRLRWLTEPLAQKPKSEGIERSQDSNAVSAVVMDWPIGDDRIATVLAASSGDASLYTTGSFGIIGGIGHENVRKAAVALTDDALRYLALATPTTDYSYPDKGQIKFFFVLPSGVKSITFSPTDVEQLGSPARDLFAHAQEVLTELRLIVPPQGAQH
jgi:hypothetical protein